MALIADHAGLQGDLYRTIQIIPLQCLFDLADCLTDLQPCNRRLLPDDAGLAVFVVGVFEDLFAGREPAVLHMLPCLSHLERAVPVSEPSLLHLATDSRTELGDISSIASQLFRLIAVEQGQLYALRFEILLATLGQGPSQPTDELLATTMLPDILRLDDLKGFVESAIRNRTFGLF
jgi:hypothetical protein